MKLKFLAMLGLSAGLMLQSCSDDDAPIDYSEPDVEAENPKDNAFSDKVDLTGYKAQKAFNLADVTLSNATYDVAKTYQKVVGIGAMLTPKGWAPSPSVGQIDELYNEYGLNILRLYIYGDKSQWSSDIDVIKQAVKDGAVIIACPWEAPASLTETTNQIVWSDGTKSELQKDVKHLKHTNWTKYAKHLIDYVAYMKQQGVSIYAMSVQNEPDAEFMYWDPKEIRMFVEQYGEEIVAKTGVKLMAPEACGMREDYTNEVLNSSKAYAATNIIAGHLYQGFSNINGTAHNNGYVKNRYNYINGLWAKISGDKKQWWMTEHLFNDGENETDTSKWQFLNWDYCLNHLALEMHDCMAASCSAYVYWYIKRFYGLIYDNDAKGRSGGNKENTYSHNAFIMAQWAGFASGKTRMEAKCDDKDIKLTAYKNSKGNELSFVAINFGSKTKYLSIPVDTDEFVAYGITSDKGSQAKQQLTKIRPNCFTERVVLAIPAMGIGSVTVLK